MIRQVAAVVCLALACADSPRAGRVAFDIPAGPVIDTLSAWHQQAHMSVLFDYQDMKHAGNTRSIRGEFDKFEGLRLMTTGTRTKFDIVNDSTVVFRVEHF